MQQSTQGQTGQQNQLRGQGQQTTDRDLLQVCLNETKHLASSLNLYIQEAVNPQLRRDYLTILGEVYNHEHQLFDYMQQKGFYSVKNATPQDISQAQNRFSSQSQQSLS